MQNDARDRSRPSLSVLVAIGPGSKGLEALLRSLSEQTASAESFELVVVSGDAESAAALRPDELPFRCTAVVRPGIGKTAARNVALLLAEAPLVLFVDDDGVPAESFVERHLAAHAELGPGVAVVGALPFSQTALASPLARMIDATPALRPWSVMEDGAEVGWPMFRTNNLSVAASAILDAGGFDETNFGDMCGDDVELGLRVTAGGTRVIHRADCVCETNHQHEASTFAARALDAGRAVARMHRIHGDVVPCWPEDANERAEFQESIVGKLEAGLSGVEDRIAALEAIEAEQFGKPIDRADLERGGAGLIELAEYYRIAGLHQERTGIDPFSVMFSGAPAGTTVSVIVISMNALAITQRCVEALRAGADARYPQEVIVVDNGSTDGSAEWLAAQDDVILIRNKANHGAPRARNQALTIATGQWIAFLDGDVFVPREWLGRALYHGAIDSSVGSVALCANRASRHQVVPYQGGDDQASIDAFASKHYRSSPREGKETVLFTSLAVLVRREAMVRIGGWDEAFSPWGFDDDDLALRIHLSGWRNRVARDTFVFHAPYPTQEKVERHAGWLEANWRSFLAKWSPASGDLELFDYSDVRVPTRASVRADQLYCALPTEDTPPPKWEDESAEELLETIDSLESVDTLGDFIAETASDLARSAEAAAPRAPASHARPHVVVLSAAACSADALTGALAMQGWSCGDAPNPATPGFHADAEVIGINEWLVSGAAVHAESRPSMQQWLATLPESCTIEHDDELARRMQRIAAAGPVALDDPRLCYTIGEWRGALGSDARMICWFDDPSSSADAIVRAARVAGHEVDRDHALDVWESMYRRVLAESARGGRWLFVHARHAAQPSVAAKVGEFVGAEPDLSVMNANPRGQSPVPANAARLYAELCARAERQAEALDVLPEPAPATSVDTPELSVLICTFNRKDTLRRCIESFERQTAAGRYEIVVVDDDGSTDGTREMLAEWTPKAPLKIVQAPDAGLAAARNRGLEAARGRFVLLVNDDTIAAPDLVEEHLRAHAERGPGAAILGTFEQPREALDNALMRVLERTPLVFCYSLVEPGVAYDWNRFWTCNVSVATDDVRAVGGFDESFRHYGCEDTDLGVRLCAERGMKLWYEPNARATHEHVLTYEDVRKRARTVAAAYVRLFQKHPHALQHPGWQSRANHTLQENEALLVRTLSDRARAERFARELSRIDVGALERGGPEGQRLADAICADLEAYLHELNHLWWAEGECDGFREFGLAGMTTMPRPVGAGV